MTNASYVNEIQAVIDLGIPAEDVRKLYDALTDKFTEYYSVVDAEEFHDSIGHLRKTDKRYFRQIIDEVASEYGLTWREVKFVETRVKRCETCQSWFYVTARNGKSLTCERFGIYRRFNLTTRAYYYWERNGRKLSECAVKYELSKRPPTKRRVQEVSFDPSPSSADVMGNVFLDDVEKAHQRQINPYNNEWTYWQR